MNRYNSLLSAIAALAIAFAGSQALAWHPETVKELAHEAEYTARQTHRAAEAALHHGNRAEMMAVQALHDLENAATHLHRLLESNNSSSVHTERDFHNLGMAYNRASRRLHRAHFTNDVMNNFFDFEDAFRALEDEYYEQGHDDDRGGH